MHFIANVRSGTEVCDCSQILGIKSVTVGMAYYRSDKVVM